MRGFPPSLRSGGFEGLHYESLIGWDVGGVNIKAARVEAGRIIAVRGRPFELQRAPGELVPLLRELAGDVGCPADNSRVAHAVTMTAELSQMFRTKREGVAFVIDAVAAAFPASEMRVFAVDGRFLTPADANADPLAVAAANWSATAHLVALDNPDALLIDIGTTTTDIIPIAGGAVVARGRTDPERLASGELVYTGALRTPAEAIASEVPLRGEMVGVSAEGFALAGDVHVWRGDLAPDDYTVPTPDGRPATREFAGERLARVICADRDMLDGPAVSAIADALAAAQIARIAAAVRRVVARHPTIDTVVVTGLGAFLGGVAARAAGLNVVPLAGALGEAAARFAPAAAVAVLRARSVDRESQPARHEPQAARHEPLTVDREPQTVRHESQAAHHEPRATAYESRATAHEPRATPYESRATDHESRATAHESRATAHESRATVHESRATAHEPRATAYEARGTAHEPRATAHEPRATAYESRATAHEPRATAHEPRATAYEARATAHEPRATVHESRATAHESRAASSDPRAPRTVYRAPRTEHQVPSTEYQVPSTEYQVPSTEYRVGLVVKIGGGLLAKPECFDAVLSSVVAASRQSRVLVVPGGGPFADAVRRADDQFHLSDDAAHWMAVLAMDQYAHLIAGRLEHGALVATPPEIQTALDAGCVPVLTPSRWLRDVDPLPHSWDVTSDSIAAWVAGVVGARRLVLVKPAGVSGENLVDSYFSRALPSSVSSVSVPADDVDALLSSLRG